MKEEWDAGHVQTTVVDISVVNDASHVISVGCVQDASQCDIIFIRPLLYT